MAYVLTLLAALGLFLWATPAHNALADSIRNGARVISEVTASGSAPLRARFDQLYAAARSKAMELLRKELHRTIDSSVN